MARMTETATTAGPPKAKRANGKDKKLGPVLVSGNRLAVHFGCVRQYIDALAAQGVIERRAVDGLFDMDQSRLRFIKHLRERRPSVRTEADAEHVKAKTQMLQFKLARERGELRLCTQLNVARRSEQ
jgi:hypothetical protein